MLRGRSTLVLPQASPLLEELRRATFRTCKRKRNPSVDPESNEYRPTKRRSIRRPTQRSVNGLEALDEISSEPFIDLKLAKRWPKDNMLFDARKPILFMREGAAEVWLTTISSLSSASPSPPTSPSLEQTGSVRVMNIERRSQPASNFAQCPSELLVAIAEYVDDLRTLASVSRLFEGIASHVDFGRHRKFLPEISTNTGVILLDNALFHRALWSWKHTGNIPLSQKHQMSYIVQFSDNDNLAKAQAKSLLGFLSTPFTTCPFSSITVFNANAFSLTDILNLLLFCDHIGCREVSIESNRFKEQSGAYQHPDMLTRSAPLLEKIHELKIDLPHLRPDEWSYLFKYIDAPHLKSLEIRGLPTLGRFGKFLSRHPQISTLSFYSPGANPQFRRSQSKITLPRLCEIQGPAANVTAILSHLDSPADLITVEIEPKYGTTWSKYISGVLDSVRSIDALVQLKIHMTSEFAKASAKTRRAEVKRQAHNVLTIDVSFCSSIERRCIPSCCEVWFDLLPGVEHANVHSLVLGSTSWCGRPRRVVKETLQIE